MASLKSFLTSKQYCRIPFTFTLSNHVRLSAEINSVKGSFLLDTGASATCVSAEDADFFNLLANEEKDFEGAGAGNSSLQLQLSEKNSLKIGDWKKKKTDIMLLDLSYINAGLRKENVEEINGVIGTDVLKKGKAILDYGSKCLFLK